MAERINLAGLSLEKPVMVGAGPIKLLEHVLEIAKSDSAAIIVGSITVEERSGNSGNTYFADSSHSFSINSKGLPNPGLVYYKRHLLEMVQIAHDYGKPLLVSAAGFLPEEYAHIAEVIMKCGVDGQELNLGCPNVWGTDGKQKRIASFDQDITGETLRRVEEAVGFGVWTAVKLSPYSDPTQLEAIASIISNSQLINAVTTTNTFSNAFAFNEDDEQAITPAGGLSGMAGESLKSIGLGQVKQLRAVLPSAIAVIGVGGISSNKDVKDYLRVGASATQITTAYINFGPSIFSQVLK